MYGKASNKPCMTRGLQDVMLGQSKHEPFIMQDVMPGQSKHEPFMMQDVMLGQSKRNPYMMRDSSWDSAKGPKCMLTKWRSSPLSILVLSSRQ